MMSVWILDDGNHYIIGYFTLKIETQEAGSVKRKLKKQIIFIDF